jgi:hypothetical protein
MKRTKNSDKKSYGTEKQLRKRVMSKAANRENSKR